MSILAIDGGTTSTRAWVVAEGAVVGEGRVTAGARDLATGRDRGWLAEQVAAAAREALDRAGASWTEVEAAVAFGMITSEHGLEEVPHLPAPAGREALAAGLRRCCTPTPLAPPLYLVPGVLTGGRVPDGDFMRGEETQVVGLLACERHPLPLLYVSAGSHAKFIVVGGDGRISASFTTLSGELLWALARETILAAAIDPELPLSDAAAADRGSAVEGEVGLGRALYSGRLLARLEEADVAACTDFVRGAIAASDVRGLRAVEDLPEAVVLGPGSPLRAFYERLLGREPWVRSCTVTDLPLGALGAWDLWRAARPRLAG
jgi:2-dehydro-3-deoxygalactonokinase